MCSEFASRWLLHNGDHYEVVSCLQGHGITGYGKLVKKIVHLCLRTSAMQYEEAHLAS